MVLQPACKNYCLITTSQGPDTSQLPHVILLDPCHFSPHSTSAKTNSCCSPTARMLSGSVSLLVLSSLTQICLLSLSDSRKPTQCPGLSSNKNSPQAGYSGTYKPIY
jgi:hypothetical protein